MHDPSWLRRGARSRVQELCCWFWMAGFLAWGVWRRWYCGHGIRWGLLDSIIFV